MIRKSRERTKQRGDAEQAGKRSKETRGSQVVSEEDEFESKYDAAQYTAIEAEQHELELSMVTIVLSTPSSYTIVAHHRRHLCREKLQQTCLGLDGSL